MPKSWIYLKLNDTNEVYQWAECSYKTPEEAQTLAERTASKEGVLCEIRTGADRQVVARAFPLKKDKP